MKNKKLFSILVLICMVFSLVSCSAPAPSPKTDKPAGAEETPEPTEPTQTSKEIIPVGILVSDEDLEDTSVPNVVMNISWNSMSLDENDMASYPKLFDAIDNLNNDARDNVDDIIADFREITEGLSLSADAPLNCVAESRITISRADSVLVSYMDDIFINAGSAHPTIRGEGTTIDTQSGEKLGISDVITDMSELVSVLEEKITDAYSEIEIPDFADTLNGYSDDEYEWTISYEGIRFVFNDLVPHAAGMIEAEIKFDEAPSLFVEKYVATVNDLVIPEVDTNAPAVETEFASVIDFDANSEAPYFAVAFLGYGDKGESARRTVLDKVFENLPEYDFDSIVSFDFEGDEWYLIVPRYESVVELTSLDDGEKYTLNKGEAFIVRGNLSDIHPNMEICYADGEHTFSPKVGGAGELIASDDILDITDYDALQ